jgi:hypothetical protein
MKMEMASKSFIVISFIMISILMAPLFISTNLRASDQVNETNSVELLGLPEKGNFNYLAVGDVNKDNYPDIVASGAGRGGYYEAAPGGLHVFLNKNGTTFINGSTGLPDPSDEYFHDTHAQIQLADVDNDSNLDIIAAEWLSHREESLITIWLGNGGDGGVVNWTLAAGPGVFGSWSGVASGDIDNDGHMDLVAGGAYGLFVWKGKHSEGELNWTAAGNGLPDSIHHVSGIQLADVNNDGRLDIVTGLEQGTGVQVYTCSTTGKISWTESHIGTHLSSTKATWDVLLRDINKDSKLDLIVSTDGEGIRAYLGNGNSGDRSTWWVDISDGLPTKGSYFQLAAGDVNNDGRLDISSSLRIWSLYDNLSEASSYSWENLDAGFSEEVSVGIGLTDLDLDGSTDIVCSGWEQNFPGIHAFTNIIIGDGKPKDDGGVPRPVIPDERVWYIKKDILEKWEVRPNTRYIFVAMIGWEGLIVENELNNLMIGFDDPEFKNTMGKETAEVIMYAGWKAAYVIYDDGSNNLPGFSYMIHSNNRVNPQNWPYELQIIYFDGENSYQVNTTDPKTKVQISSGSTHRFRIDWDTVKNNNTSGIRVNIDSDNDGIYESAMSPFEVDKNVMITLIEGQFAPQGESKNGGETKDDGKTKDDSEDAIETETDNDNNTQLTNLILIILICILIGLFACGLFAVSSRNWKGHDEKKDDQRGAEKGIRNSKSEKR